MTSYAFRLLPLSAAVILAACGQTPRPGATLPPKMQGVDNAQQVADVVAALEAGDEKRARKLLKKMAARDPGDRRVAVLRESIDGDPRTLLGAKSFGYSVQRGESFLSLAQRFLGDRLKFHLLVRYNGLKTSQIAPGTIIRLPGDEPVAAPVVKRPRLEAQPAKPSAAATPPPPVVRAPVKPVTNPALAAALRMRGLAALNQGQVAQAVIALRRARAADPANAAVQRDLARAERLHAAVKERR